MNLRIKRKKQKAMLSRDEAIAKMDFWCSVLISGAAKVSEKRPYGLTINEGGEIFLNDQKVEGEILRDSKFPIGQKISTYTRVDRRGRFVNGVCETRGKIFYGSIFVRREG